jgi:hypothetical protein
VRGTNFKAWKANLTGQAKTLDQKARVKRFSEELMKLAREERAAWDRLRERVAVDLNATKSVQQERESFTQMSSAERKAFLKKKAEELKKVKAAPPVSTAATPDRLTKGWNKDANLFLQAQIKGIVLREAIKQGGVMPGQTELNDYLAQVFPRKKA